MATNISKLLTVAAPAAIQVVRGVGDDQFDRPTPCAEYRVRELLNHLFHVVVSFQALAAKQPADFTTVPDYLVGDWRDRFEAETALLIEAWSDPSAVEGLSSGMSLPMEKVGNMALLDLTVHAWDLARATGQPFAPDPAAVTALFALTAQMGPTARKMGVFGEPVTLPADADEFDRLLATTGRDPSLVA